MTVKMGYTRLTSEMLQGDLQAILAILGTDPLCGWLEDPMDKDGLALREGIDPANVMLRVDGVLIPEAAGADDGPSHRRLWPQGRLFNEGLDLQWEKLSDHLHLVTITEEPLAAPFEGIIDNLIEIGDEIYTLMLWGAYHSKEGWTEGRIPHLNRFYPANWGGPRAAIMARVYEAEWYYAKDTLPTARSVTRYICYNGNYNPSQDSRF